MYNIVISHLYNLQNDHPDRFNTHLTTHAVITILLTIVPSCNLHLHIYFYHWQFYILTPFHFSPREQMDGCQMGEGIWAMGEKTNFSKYDFLKNQKILKAY